MPTSKVQVLLQYSTWHTNQHQSSYWTIILHKTSNWLQEFICDYLLTCNCGLQYIGRTTQALRVRVNQQWSNCMRGFTKHSVSHYAATQHSNNFDTFNISVIEQIHIDLPDRFKCLQKCEMFWIYKFNTITPFGLNETLESLYSKSRTSIHRSNLAQYHLYRFSISIPKSP